MARDPCLLSKAPTAITPAKVFIGHVQLRDLLICPRERGVVNYVHEQAIIEQNLNKPDSPPRTIAELTFPTSPNSLTSLQVGNDDFLLAAGGQDAEIHLSYHSPPSSRHRRTNLVWRIETQLHGSINNSVLLTSLSLTRSNESSVEPRVAISNNDCTVKFYDVPIRGQSQKRAIRDAGVLKLDVPINHSSISPDGRTLLSVGDSNKAYLHQMSGDARINFSHITTLSLPPPDVLPLGYPSSSLTASFSTAFSTDGLKFAVASQEGIVAVWDVRSTKPLKVFQTDKMRIPSGNGSSAGWRLSDDPYEWTRGNSRAPGWSVRNVKFSSGGEGGYSGKELMVFTEHTSYLHVVDARTFETEEIIRVPTVRRTTPVGSPKPEPAAIQPQPHSPTAVPAHQPPHHPLPSNVRRSRSSLTRVLLPTLSPSSSSSRLSPASPPQFIVSGPSSPRRPTPSSQPPIVQALGDAFRIPTQAYSPPSSISDSTWRTLRGFGLRATANGIEPIRTATAGDDYDELLVIPPLGDRDVESEVHALLEIHGISSRRREADDREEEEEGDGDGDDDRGPRNGGGRVNRSSRPNSSHQGYEYHRPTTTFVGRARGDDDMEVDELESDCASSSHTPSRSSSPSPSTTQARGGSRGSAPAPGAAIGWRSEVGYEDDLDLAGVCFDPTGGWVYVGSTESVVEWSVRGREKRWSFEKGWR